MASCTFVFRVQHINVVIFFPRGTTPYSTAMLMFAHVKQSLILHVLVLLACIYALRSVPRSYRLECCCCCHSKCLKHLKMIRYDALNVLLDC